MKKWFSATVLRYFLSYFFVFCISVISLFFLFRGYLIATLTDQYESQIGTELNGRLEQLKTDIETLYTINTQIVGNVDVMLVKYNNNPAQSPAIRSELKKYVVGKTLIRAAGYIDKNHDRLFSYSTGDYLSFQNGVVTIRTFDDCLRFSPDEHAQAKTNQLLNLTSETDTRLVFLPSFQSYYNYSTFYLLDNQSIRSYCDMLLSDMVVASALVAPDGQILLSSQTANASVDAYLTQADPAYTLYQSENIYGGYRLAALYTDAVLKTHINTALRAGIPWYLLIMMVGFAIVIFCTHSTYQPLRRLADQITEPVDEEYNLFNKLNLAMRHQRTQNTDLQARIQHYRTFMQKMLLDSMLTAENCAKILEDNLDFYFMISPDSVITAFAVNATAQPTFSAADHAIMLFHNDELCVYVIKRILAHGEQPETILNDVAQKLHHNTNSFIGSSTPSSSALDIPALVKQASDAYAYATFEEPIVLWQQIARNQPTLTPNYQYPHDLLKTFSSQLSSCEFSASRKTLQQLWELLAGIEMQDDRLPDLFIRSVLIDLLSDLAIHMDSMHIKFKQYEDLYFQTLYLCRSCAFAVEKNKIHANLQQMLALYESQVDNMFLSSEEIHEIVMNNIANPDFSISNLYEGYEISPAYMTYLFKKETGENFSAYIWQARYQKACKLLAEGRLSINEISLAVGYLHPSSFRRKFKQETGMSPTDYHG